jgi:hypothetical protein
MDRQPVFTKSVLYTDHDGRAKFREERVALTEGTREARLSAVQPATGYQLRESPVGFRSEFHCTPKPQWVFILKGEMEIALQDGSVRRSPPESIFSRPTCCPKARASTRSSTGTAARSAARSRWSRCS